MKDYLENDIEVGDTVIIAIRSGRYAILGRGFIKQTKMRPQFAGGLSIPMVEVEWSNISRYWLPARQVIGLPDNMLPEKRKEKLNDTKEAVQP